MLSDNVTTTGGETKKSSKPVMEKRRRARINASLSELKSLLLQVIKKEGTRHSKMEKADILELTVRHLRQLQKEQVSGVSSSEGLGYDKYRLGFNDCFTEMSRYLSDEKDVDAELRIRVLDHLSNYLCERVQTQPSVAVVTERQAVHSTVSSSGTARVGVPTLCMDMSSCSSGGSVGQRKPAAVGSDIKPTFLHLVNSGPGPAILAPMGSGVSNNHNKSTVHLATFMAPSENPQNGVSLSNGAAQLHVSPQSGQSQTNSFSHTGSTITLGSAPETKVFNNLHLLPTKLPNGGVAYVLPTNVPVIPQSSSCIPSYVIPVFTSPELVSGSGSVAVSQQPVSVPSEVTSTAPQRVYPGNDSTNLISASATIPMCPTPISCIVPNSKYLPKPPTSLPAESILPNSLQTEEIRHQSSPLRPLIPTPGGAVVSLPSVGVHAAPQVIPQRIEMAQHDDMWRPW